LTTANSRAWPSVRRDESTIRDLLRVVCATLLGLLPCPFILCPWVLGSACIIVEERPGVTSPLYRPCHIALEECGLTI
jgi:hypothetical protein